MERIDVWRGEAETDADGNTVQGPLTLITSFDGLVAPASTPETVSEESSGVTFDQSTSAPRNPPESWTPT